jgi:hypothetical protein
MSKKNEIIKVPFYENELIAVEKDGETYVAMKPIVEALGLAWHKQYELIQRDLVLRQKGIPITGIPSKGGPQEMLCLPLKYLNGWLFKVPASRYTGKKREVIIRYQEECYSALYEYFRNDTAVNPLAALKKNDPRDWLLRRQSEIIDEVTSDTSFYGDVSPVTGRKKLVLVRQHFRSYAEPQVKKPKNRMQMVFNFFTGGK